LGAAGQPDDLLQQWVADTIGDVAVSLDAPGAPLPGRGVGLYLLELDKKPPSRGASPPPLQFWLRYLVTTWSESPQDAHELLFSLAFAALDHPEFEVDLTRGSPELWSALGVAPMPAFLIQVPLVQHRPALPARLVRQPLEIQSAGVVTLQGTVLAGRTPVPAADVDLPALGAATRTDARGRFQFRSVPSAPESTLVRVRARGYETTTTTKAYPNRPIVIKFNPWESEDAGISDS
jgi:hypothetical protein